ncbi:cyclase family protein [Fodinicola acaciae]|uniref:cyclase family protein n=1 Tax=Fodinicola acaciae TaxID=2681555 RepID=UPI0013D186FF|nr:cyclase family protein [Fodinicola acaciae]
MLYDLSHPVNDVGPCTFATNDKRPRVSFEEGDSHGHLFITSRIDNLYSNTATHVDLPGHLVESARFGWPTVGQIPIDRFIGPCAILDFSHRCEALQDWFTDEGVFRRGRLERFDEFLALGRGLGVSRLELEGALKSVDAVIPDLKGVLLYSGLSRFWTNGVFESWEHAYFYAPFLMSDAIEFLIGEASALTFVGIDAFQLEDPISNLRGDELPLISNELSVIEAKRGVRTMVKAAVAHWRERSVHQQLFEASVVIYENLNVPAALANKCGTFSGPPLNLQLESLNDNALVRPYFVVD